MHCLAGQSVLLKTCLHTAPALTSIKEEPATTQSCATTSLMTTTSSLREDENSKEKKATAGKIQNNEIIRNMFSGKKNMF